MPMREALRRCPQAVVVTPRFKRYREISAQVFEVFREFTDLVEGLSLDEAFLDVTGSAALFGSGEEMAREIKRRDPRAHRAHRLRRRLAQQAARQARLGDGQARRAHGDPAGGRARDAGPAAGRAAVRHRRRRRRRGSRSRASSRSASCARAPESVLWPLFRRETRKFQDRAAGIDERPVVVRRAREADQLRGNLRRRHPRPQGDAGAARAARRPHDGAPAHAAVQGRHGQHQGAPPRLRDLHAPAELQPADPGDAPDRAGRRGPARPLARGAAARGRAPARRRRQRPRARDPARPVLHAPSSPSPGGSTTPSTASTGASATTPSTAAATAEGTEEDVTLAGLCTCSGGAKGSVPFQCLSPEG